MPGINNAGGGARQGVSLPQLTGPFLPMTSASITLTSAWRRVATRRFVWRRRRELRRRSHFPAAQVYSARHRSGGATRIFCGRLAPLPARVRPKHFPAILNDTGPRGRARTSETGLLRLLPEQELAGVMAHELAHVRNRDTLVMTITAAITGRGGLDAVQFRPVSRRQPEQSVGDRGLDPRHDRGAARGHAGAGSDFQNPRICRGSGGRGDLRQSPVACPRPGAAGGSVRAGSATPRRELPGNSTPVHRQFTPARFHRSPVLNPSEDRGSCPSTPDDGGGCACHDAIPAVLRCSSPIRESAPRGATSALAVGSALSISPLLRVLSRGAEPLRQARMAERGFHLASVSGTGLTWRAC